MLNIQQIQRQRARLYKNDLRRQFQQRQQLIKNQSMQLKNKDNQALKQKIDVTIKEMQMEKQRENYIKNKLKQQNMMLANIKNIYNSMEQNNRSTVPLKGNNLMDNLYQGQDRRSYQGKKIAKILLQQNNQQDNIHKSINKQVKQIEKSEQLKHMERMIQLQNMRKRQYEDIKQRHSPEPKPTFEIHKKLQQMNQQYKKSLESFAYNGRDILDSLKRDQRKQRFQRNRSVQSQLKMQMEQKKVKDYIEKVDHRGQPEDLKKSILGNILFKGPNYDKKQYANYLMKQMNQTDLRRSYQKIQNKQKIQVNSIFGGQGGPQRLKMIKYIDRNLGIQSQMLKKVQPGMKSNSSFRLKNIHLYNGQNPENMNNINKSFNYQETNKMNEYNQKIHTQHGPNQNLQENNQRSKDQQSRRSDSRLEQNPKNPPRSYLSYDFIKGSQKRYEI